MTFSLLTFYKIRKNFLRTLLLTGTRVNCFCIPVESIPGWENGCCGSDLVTFKWKISAGLWCCGRRQAHTRKGSRRPWEIRPGGLSCLKRLLLPWLHGHEFRWIPWPMPKYSGAFPSDPDHHEIPLVFRTFPYPKTTLVLETTEIMVGAKWIQQTDKLNRPASTQSNLWTKKKIDMFFRLLRHFYYEDDKS